MTTDTRSDVGDWLALIDAPAIALDQELRVLSHNDAWSRACEQAWVRALVTPASALASIAAGIFRTAGAFTHESRTVADGSDVRHLRLRARGVGAGPGRVAIITLASKPPAADAELERFLDDLPVGVVRRVGGDLWTNRAMDEIVGAAPDAGEAVRAWCERSLTSADDASDAESSGTWATRTAVVQTLGAGRRALEIARRHRGLDEHVSLVTDVTERAHGDALRTRLVAELQRAHEQLTLAFDAIGDAIVVLDDAGVIAQLNAQAQEQFGCDGDGCIGQPLSSFAHIAPWREIGPLLASAEPFEREIVEPQMQRAWIVTGRPIEAPGLAPRRVVIARDMSAALALQRSAGEQTALATMGALVGGVAHEVRNPLFGISAMLDLFEAELGTNPEFTEYVGALRTQVSRLSSLMQDLLEYGRPVRFVLTPTVVTDIVEDAVSASRLVAATQGVSIDHEVVGELPPVPLDALRFGQALRNLIENACQHSPRGSTVALTAQRRDVGGQDVLEIQVRDRGAGFRETDLARVFEPFYTRRRGGTGLGLAIVKRVVVDHQGDVAASNADQGAVVTIRVPLPAGL